MFSNNFEGKLLVIKLKIWYKRKVSISSIVRGNERKFPE